MRDSEKYPFFGTTLQKFAKDVETSLTEMLPNFGPFKCEGLYLYEKPSISESIPKIFRFFN